MPYHKTFVYEMQTEFEDVDAGGVVHHPNYLKYYERARSQVTADKGYPYGEMVREGIALAIAEAYLSYRAPIGFYQKIFVMSRVLAVRRSNFKVGQAICSARPSVEDLKNAGPELQKLPQLLHFAELRLVCISLKELKPVSIPPPLLKAFGIQDEKNLPPEAKEVRVRP